MKKKECPSCAMEIDDNQKICPICNYEFPQGTPTYKIVALILIALFLVMLLIQLT